MSGNVSYIEMGVSSNSDIKELLLKNHVPQVTSLVGVNPKVLLENPDLIKEARSYSMVRTLLLLNRESETLVQSSDVVQSDLENEDDQVLSDVKNIQIQSINATLPTLLQRWPSVVREILDSQITYDGFCAEDPGLKVDIDVSLLSRSTFSAQNCFSVAKPDQLINLSELDVTKAESRDILLHPVILTYVHLESKSMWKTILLKFIMFLAALFSNISIHVYTEIEPICNLIGGIMFSSQVTKVLCFCFYVLIVIIHIINELPTMIFNRKSHVKEFWFQMYVIISFFLSMVTKLVDAGDLFCTNEILAFLLNLLLALSSNVMFGKYIFLSMAVAKTLVKAIPPILFLIMGLAVSEFVLRYEEILKHHDWNIDLFEADRGKLLDLNFSLTNSSEIVEICQSVSPFTGQLFQMGRSSLAKIFLQVLSGMYGQIDNADVARDYLPLRDYNSEIVTSYAIYWLIATTLTTLILVNLLIGLAIGDIRAIDETADCLIVQIELKSLYRRIMWKNFRSCLCKCFGKSCRAKCGNSDILTLYPNKSSSIYLASGKKKTQKLTLTAFATQFILGWQRVKRSIMNNYKNEKF